MNEVKKNSTKIVENENLEKLAAADSKNAGSAAKIILVLVLLCALMVPVSLIAKIGMAFRGPRSVMSLPVVQGSRSQIAALMPDLPELPELASSGRVRVWTNGYQIGPESFPLQGGPEDQFVLGGTYSLSEEETLDGNLVVLGGIATLDDGSTINGDVLLLGGTVRGDGEIDGDVFIIGGLLDLSETAVVKGDVNTIGGHVEYENRESIEGEINTGIDDIPPVILPGEIIVPNVNVGSNWFLRGIGWAVGYMFRAFLWTVLAVLVLLFLQQPAERVSQVIVSQPIISAGLGLMTAFVAPLLLAVIAITIIGIPVSLLGFAVLALAWAFGLVVVGTEIGKRIARGFNQEWALPVQAALGTLVLVLLLNAIVEVPCIGWIVPLLVGSLGLGAVLLTRFGTQDYPSDLAAPLAPSAPAEPEPPFAPEVIKDAALIDAPDVDAAVDERQDDLPEELPDGDDTK